MPEGCSFAVLDDFTNSVVIIALAQKHVGGSSSKSDQVHAGGTVILD